VPALSLANHLFLRQVPFELQDLTLASILPPTIDDIVTPLCVILIGSSPPLKEWLLQQAKPLTVHCEKVRNALVWLKRHNTL